jgi:mono/diheme cytochrome c family protein
MKVLHAAVLIGIATGFGAGPAPASAQQQAATGSVSNGRQIYYEQTCYGCHGFNGETGARDLAGTDSPVLADAETFTRFLRMRANVAPLLPSTRMPNYPASEIDDREARDLFAFIDSFRRNDPDVEDVPTLQTILESAERPYDP